MKARLYLIPTPIASDTVQQTLPASVLEVAPTIRFFLVENIRTARRFLASLKQNIPIDDLTFVEIGKHSDPAAVLTQYKSWVDTGTTIGLMSEAGCPAIADPGNIWVQWAHQWGVEVMPLVGPSSLMLALMGSGLHGQCFAFHGYLPIDTQARVQKLKWLEKQSAALHQTQLFIETPFRNQALWKDLLQHCHKNTWLSFAANLTAPDQLLLTYRIEQWHQKNFAPPKAPCVFLLMS